MAQSWLELQEQLKSGAASLPNPVPSSDCGVSTTQSAQTDLLNLPDLGSLTQPLDDFLGSVQGEIDQFGSEVMGVLQDIGAWIPSELQGFGSSDSTTNEKKSTVADVTKINHTILANGEVCVSDGVNEDTGDSYYSVVTSSGGAVHCDPDGSVKITAGKNPSTDPKTGGIHLIAQGPGVQKYGEFLAIEVNNDNEVLGKTGFSIVVYGNVDIESRGGDIKMGGKNIAITASDSVEINGADIKLYAGSASTTTTAGKAKEEQGGTIELKAGVIKQSHAGQQNIEGATYNKVDGEKLFYMGNSQGNFGIESSGTLTIKTGGDMLEEVGGRKMTEVFSQPAGVSLEAGLIPPKPMVLGVSAGYYVVNKFPVLPAPGKDVADLPPLMYVHSPSASGGHGFRVDATLGNIGLFSTLGSVAIGTNFGAFADISNPFKSPTTPKSVLQLVRPGTYVTSIDYLSLTGKLSTAMYTGPLSATPPIDDSIVITPAVMKISSLKGGIFLN